MSVPSAMLQRLTDSQKQELPGGGMPGPAGAPMNTPQKQDGKQETARVHVHIAMNMLEQALPAFGAESEEGKVILSTLSRLARKFGDTNASDLAPAQIKELVQGSTQVGGGSPVQRRLMQMVGQPQQQQPGGAPQRMPGMQ